MIIVYKITNTVTGAEYIGKTIKIRPRLNVHFFELKRGIHPSKAMQFDFHKHGEASFEHKIIRKFKLKEEASEFELDLIYKKQPKYNTRGKIRYIEPLEKTSELGRPRKSPTRVVSFRVSLNIGNAQIEMIKQYIASIDFRK